MARWALDRHPVPHVDQNGQVVRGLLVLGVQSPKPEATRHSSWYRQGLASGGSWEDRVEETEKDAVLGH